MGCCESKQNLIEGQTGDNLRESIVCGTMKQFMYHYYILLSKNKESFNIDTELIKDSQGDTLNLLGLGFAYGRVDIVRWLHESCNACFIQMEKLLNRYNSSGLDIIAKNGYISLFEYYIPIYIKIRKQVRVSTRPEERSSETLKLDQSEITKEFISLYPEANFTPIQHACINGKIPIIQLFHSLSLKIGPEYEEFDVHFVEKTYGYNCALLSACTSNFHMIKYLHTLCKADFHLLNYNKESAIQVLLAEKNRGIDTLRCLEYLVESIGVDVTYNYEETLILSGVQSTSEYLLKKLAEKGIVISKSRLRQEILSSSEVIQETRVENKKVLLSDIINDLKKDEVSSIIVRSPSQSSQEEAIIK